MTLRQMLRDIADGVAGMRMNPTTEFNSFYHLVVELGRVYRPQKLPRQYRGGIPQHCYMNATELAMEHSRTLIYVEGYVLVKKIPIPIQHAWCARAGSNLVVDNTPGEKLTAYFGIPFTQDYLKGEWDKKEGGRSSASLIDNVEDGFPLLRMPREKLIREVIYGEKEIKGSQWGGNTGIQGNAAPGGGT